ncbi:M16 family metallopeptidase [Chromobacterium alticapitis]|uniref:Peptidase M16 C-terminal domain-containing protein n=1 Tax=Chromobacterium alticapitis TaxID=2073169 RepID=A0A2S5DJJ9_9NEIS|nr:pitrilysin family protein [Chromobacterium alticapitis]POZ63148.1 hypothetical protein C2I19_04895 [Chromobacterium alticapitis]
MRIPLLGLLLWALGTAQPSLAAPSPSVRAPSGAAAPGERFDPSPANIDRRTERLTLANGARLALLPKQTRGHVVSGHFRLAFGDAEQLAGQGLASRLTAAMLNRSALAHRQELSQTSLQISGNGQEVRIGFISQRDALPALLDLIAEQLRRPAFPQDEFDRLIRARQQEIENARHDPHAQAALTLARRLNDYPTGDVRRPPSPDEELAALRAITLEQLKNFHRRFYGADHASLALVGDFDAAATRAQLSRQYGDWNSAAPYRSLDEKPPLRPAERQMLQIAAPAKAVYLAALPLPLRDSSADYPALLLANRILGGASQPRPFQSALRADDGQNPVIWQLYAAYPPRDRTRLQTRLEAELERLSRDGVSARELAAAKRALLQDAQLARAQDDVLSRQLSRQLEAGRDMAFVAEREARLRQTSVEQVNAALRRYLRPGAWLEVYAGDFAGQAGGQLSRN